MQFPDNEIVKLRRERRKSEIELRENEITALLQQHSRFTEAERMLFDAKVITEILNNVSEHGKTQMDFGYWLIAQYHRRHEFISICIADNGIGIRNSLSTGPQASDIESRLGSDKGSDEAYIILALTQTVSGAYNAPVREGFRKRFPRGANRGNGLKRVTDTCAKLSVRMSVVSHYGYAFLNETGTIAQSGSSTRRAFAGTMFNLIVPAKG